VGRDPWFRLTAALALLLPALFLHRTFLRPATHLVAARPDAFPLDDPTTNATAMARAWARFDKGEFAARDDRVFAPAPNAIALGECYPLPSLIGYPFARLFRSVPLGVNVPYFLALALAPVAFYAFYAELAGPGPGALLGAVLVAWGPGRMNTLGVLSPLTAGLIVLAAAYAVRFLRTGRPAYLGLFTGFLLAQAFSGLYPLAQGGLWCLAGVPLAAGRYAVRPGRLAALAAAGLVAIGPAALWHAPLFRLRDSFGVVTDPSTFEAHAADVLALFHGGLFGGPVRDLLEAAVPGFPLGAAAFFPTLSVVAALGAWTCLHRRPTGAGLERSPLPWVLLAVPFFLLALGPTLRLAGRPVGPGPLTFVSNLPVLSSVRGIHRYDQWFDVSLGAAAVLAFAAVARRVRGRWLLVAAGALVALDSWPADIPSYRFPDATPAARALRGLGPDAIVAHYPMGRNEATQAWVDQVAHGRRVVNGWFTFEPLPHRWVGSALGSVDGVVALAMLRDFGAEVVVVDPSRLDPTRRAGLVSLRAPDAALRLRAVSRAGGLDLYWFEPRSPHVLSVASLEGLAFRGREAVVEESLGSLILFFGPRSLDVEVISDVGTEPNRLLVPPVQPSVFRVHLEKPGRAGSEVRDARSGRIFGKTEAAAPHAASNPNSVSAPP
jgi:hypothetical protein